MLHIALRKLLGTYLVAPSWAVPTAAVSVCLSRHVGVNTQKEYLLVKRAKEPGMGKWSLCGGRIELGEETIAAAWRELEEETSLINGQCKLYPEVFLSSDAIYRKDDGNVEFHYVIQHLYGWASPKATPIPGDDASDVSWFSRDEIVSLTSSADVAGSILNVIDTAERLQNCGFFPSRH